MAEQEVVGDKKHKVQSFSGPPQGAFIYNAMEAGEHEIHLKPDVGYFASTKKLVRPAVYMRLGLVADQ